MSNKRTIDDVCPSPEYPIYFLLLGILLLELSEVTTVIPEPAYITVGLVSGFAGCLLIIKDILSNGGGE